MPDFAVISGLVDGKNDRGQRFQFPFCAIGDSKKLVWVKSAGTAGEVELPDAWRARAQLIDSMASGDQTFASYGAIQIRMFIQDGQVFQRSVLQGNVKAFEHELARFVSDRLGLKSVVVARMDELSREEVEDEEAAMERREASKESPSPEDADRQYRPEVPHLVVLTCQPVLDPVGGIALHDIKEGDEILAALPEDSFFYDLFKSKLPDFDGVVSARVISAKKTDTGSTQVDLFLSEGLVGVLRLSGNVRIKRSVQPVEEVLEKPKVPSPMILLSAGVLLAVAAGVLYYLLLR